MKKFLALLALTVCGSAWAVSAESYVVMDMDGHVLAEQNAHEVRPIASITKLVTASWSITQDPADKITITRDDLKATYGNYRKARWRPGMTLTRDHLLNLALVHSDNVAAVALGRSTTQDLSILPSTMQIVEPSGVLAENHSTAYDVAELARKLANTDVAQRSVQPTVSLGREELHSTNPLIDRPGWKFWLSKTGYTKAAGGCLVVVTEWAGRMVTVAILGSSNVRSRWMDLYELRRQWDDGEYTVPEIAPYRHVSKPQAKAQTRPKKKKRR